MTAKDPVNGPQLTPYLLYSDVAGALKFLSKAFGFKQFGDSHKGPDGKLTHASMQFGGAMIMMGYPGKQYKNPKKLRAVTQSIYVMVDDVDKHYKKAVKAGARILSKPEDMFYGHRRYGAADPEGHEWYFASETAE